MNKIEHRRPFKKLMQIASNHLDFLIIIILFLKIKGVIAVLNGNSSALGVKEVWLGIWVLLTDKHSMGWNIWEHCYLACLKTGKSFGKTEIFPYLSTWDILIVI